MRTRYKRPTTKFDDVNKSWAMYCSIRGQAQKFPIPINSPKRARFVELILCLNYQINRIYIYNGKISPLLLKFGRGKLYGIKLHCKERFVCLELWLSVGQLLIHCHLSGNHIGCPGQSDKRLFWTLAIGYQKVLMHPNLHGKKSTDWFKKGPFKKQMV